MTTEYKQDSLRRTKSKLINAHDEISTIAGQMEAQLATEYDRATSKEYGLICQALGNLEEQIAAISNQLTKLKK